MKRTSLVVSTVLALFFLPGCVLSTGKHLPEVEARAITPGKTTKDELFTRFGAPAAILRRGEVAVINTPSVWPTRMANQYSYSVLSDTAFELFPAAGRPGGQYRIYYYRHVVSRKFLYFLLFVIYESGNTNTDQLWALVNENQGIVEDYAFKKYDESVLFGRMRGENRERNAPFLERR